MMISSRLHLATPLALVLASLAFPNQDREPQEQGPETTPRLVELRGELTRIPFTLGTRRPIPVVEALVNGQGPFSFYYDTGASVCVLDSGFVAELGIPALGPTEIGDHTATARIPAERVELESLELEGIRFEGIPAIAFDRSRFGGDTIRGVLGLPLFRDHLLTVDYPRSRLEVSTAQLPEEGQGILPYHAGPLPEITITVGGEPVACNFDSGSPGGFMFPTSVVESLPHKTEPRVLGTARTVNSEFEIWSVQLDATILVAGNEFVDAQVGYNEILPNGNIGYQVLKDLALSIDQRSRRIRLVPSQVEQAAGDGTRRVSDGRRQGRRSLGVGLAARGANLSVSQVMEGSAAEQAGLRVGDVLVRIDGEVATHERLGKALESAGEIRLEVERGGEALELVLFGDHVGGTGPAALARVQDPAPLDKAQRTAVVEDIGRTLAEGYLFADLGQTLAQLLRSHLEAGAYDSLTERGAFAGQLTRDLYAASNDKHLRILPERSGSGAAAPGGGRRVVRRVVGEGGAGEPGPEGGAWPGMPDFARTNHGFQELRLLEGNVGYLDLRLFSPSPAARARVDAAMAFFDDVDALIIDIGQNRGGAGTIVTYLSAYLFAERTHLVDTFRRGEGEPSQRWTDEQVAGRLRPDLPVFVLTSPGTGSAAESFVFGLKVAQRVTIVGERTAGAGHFGDRMRPLAHGFEMFLPIGRTYDPATGKGFEGDGVAPDVQVPYAEALEKAHALAVAAGLARRPPPEEAGGGADKSKGR